MTDMLINPLLNALPEPVEQFVRDVFGLQEALDLPDVAAPEPPKVGFQGSDPARARYRDAANEDYAAIQEHLVVQGGDSLQLLERTGGPFPLPVFATAWPHGQVVAAALDRALVTGDVEEARKAIRGLDRFADGTTGAYKPWDAFWKQTRLYDDNAWIGLDLVQGFRTTGDQDMIDKARGVFDFLDREARHADGGIYWKENESRMSRNAASMGPAMQLALQLHDLTGEQKYLDFAKDMDRATTTHLRDERGLVRDNIGDDGTVEPALYTYNQGTAIGADLQFFQATGEEKYLQRAKATTTAALDYYGQEDRLWKQAPAFNAVFFRNLLKLDAVAPDPQIRATLERYLERARTESRQGNGLYTSESGMGNYEAHGADRTPTIDQAAFVQMHALLAMTPEQLALVS
ncbi:MAG: glycoside hydrolase family 76 [Thermoleophilia bacterium]|nr:glycoside hydrolase family 76 [Thermoleophilia bacterium]